MECLDFQSCVYFCFFCHVWEGPSWDLVSSSPSVCLTIKATPRRVPKLGPGLMPAGACRMYPRLSLTGCHLFHSPIWKTRCMAHFWRVVCSIFPWSFGPSFNARATGGEKSGLRLLLALLVALLMLWILAQPRKGRSLRSVCSVVFPGRVRRWDLFARPRLQPGEGTAEGQGSLPRRRTQSELYP